MGGIDLGQECVLRRVHAVTVEWHVNWLEYVRGMCMSYYM